jgi:carbon storage regulator
MLVISRKYQDTIVIDQRIRIKVLGIRGDRIRLGIEAPEDVAILRGELTLRQVTPTAEGEPADEAGIPTDASAAPCGAHLATATARRSPVRWPGPKSPQP